MRTAVPAVRLSRPAVAVASSLMLTGLLGAVAIGQLVPTGDAGGVAVRGGWRPVAWSVDGSSLLARGATYGLVDPAGRVSELPGTIASAAWLAGPPPRLVTVDDGDGGQRLVVRDPATGTGEQLASASAIESHGVTADGAGWTIVTPAGLVLGGTLAGAPGNGEPATKVTVAADGSRVAFRAPGDADGILGVLDVALGRMTLMTVVGVDEDAPLVFSPRGDAVALVARLGGRSGLVLVPLDPRGPPTLLVPDAAPGIPVWSQDGQRLLVARVAQGAATLEIVTVDIAAAEARVQPLGPGGVAAWLDNQDVVLVAPDGSLVRAGPDGSRLTLVSGADPTCVPVVGPDATVAYCSRDGALRLRRGA